MAKLFGVIGNRSELLGNALATLDPVLRVRTEASQRPYSWGLGFYQAGDILLRRRPSDDRETLDFSPLASDLSTDLLLGHVRAGDATTALRNENTQPFRYRQWLFAHQGSIAAAGSIRDRISANIAEFLQRNIRGESDSEVLFFLLLSFMHDYLQLDHPIAHDRFVNAVSSALSLLDSLAAEVNSPPFSLNAVLSNGEQIIAVHSEPKTADFSTAMFVRTLNADDMNLEPRLDRSDRVRFHCVASQFSAAQSSDVARSWTRLSSRAMVWATKDGDRPKIVTF